MEILSGAIVLAVLAALVILLLKILKKPIRLLFKLLVNTVFGFIGLAVINLVGGFFGVTLGVNLLNALVVGVFGLPGVALLLIVKWLAAF